MTSGVAIPLHLGVHVLGLTVAAGLAVFGLGRRRQAEPGWVGLALGGVFLAASHVVSGAFLAPDLTWAVYLRAAGYAALAMGGAGRLFGPGVPAVIATTAPGPELAAAIAGFAAAVASLRGVLGRRRDAIVLAIGITLWAGADIAMRSAATLAALASVAGSLTVGAWLLWRSRESLLSRVVASFLVALLVLVVGLASLGGVLFTADLQRDELDKLDAAAAARAAEVQTEWPSEALTIARLFAGQSLAEILSRAVPGELERRAANIAELPDVDAVVLAAPDGRVLGSYDWGVAPRGPLPAADAVLLLGDTAVQPAYRGSASSGLVVLGDGDVLAVGASPVFPVERGTPRRDQQAGVLVVARRVADPIFLDAVARGTGGAVTLVVGSQPAASTLGRDNARDVAAAVQGGTRQGMLQLGETPSFLVAQRLETGGQEVGWLALSEDAATLAGVERSFSRNLFLIALLGVGAAGLLAAWSASRTTSPIRRLTRAAERVAGGDLDVRTNISQPDEVGRLAHAFDKMTTSLAAREEELRAAAAVEAALRGRLEVLTASMGEGLVAVDAEGRVQSVNPAAERLLRVEAPKAIGKPVTNVLKGSDGSRGKLIEALGLPEETDVRATRGTIGRGKDAVPVAATAAPLRGVDGTHLGRVYVLRDVAGESEVERMKTEFLANISHELRTPLTPIKGYAEVMRQRSVAPERIVEFATNIVMATSRLERIIGMLVDFAALEAGRLRVHLEPTSLPQVVEEVLGGWRARTPHREFLAQLEPDLPDVHADPRLLGRVLEELLDNAVKFSDGPIQLAALREGGRVRLSVRDRGVGIPPEKLAGITRDFQQLDGSMTRQYGGLGLGVSLVRRIADRFGAEFLIESEPGEGTEVRLLLAVVE